METNLSQARECQGNWGLIYIICRLPWHLQAWTLHKWLYLYISVVAHGRFVLLKTLCWLHQFYITCLIFFFFAVQFNENNRRIVLTRINQKTQFYTSLFHSRIYKRMFMKHYTKTCNSNYIHPPLLPTNCEIWPIVLQIWIRPGNFENDLLDLPLNKIHLICL